MEEQRSTGALSKELFDGLKAEMTKPENLEVLMDSIAASMARRFSTEELDGLAAFYRTALGKRVAEEEAGLAIDGMQAGSIWGQKLGERVARNLSKSKGLD